MPSADFDKWQTQLLVQILINFCQNEYYFSRKFNFSWFKKVPENYFSAPDVLIRTPVFSFVWEQLFFQFISRKHFLEHGLYSKLVTQAFFIKVYLNLHETIRCTNN